jgi:filamentous hemagglutinin family protein
MNRYAIALLGCLIFSQSQSSVAQVTRDGTLSTTVSSPDNRHFTVREGRRSGNNLFHSFQEFSVPESGSVLFDNALDVQNIFSRITGANASIIDGLIQANGSANLFLLNPNGITFGANARLDIGGSFVGSTANQIRFADGFQFSAVNPIDSPLLTISVPSGLQFGANPRAIAVNNIPTSDLSTNLGLTVSAGQSLSLVGGEIIFNGGRLTSIGGSIQLAGLAQSGIIGLEQDGTLSLPKNRERADVILRNGAQITAAAPFPRNSIEIEAGRLSLSQGSQLLSGVSQLTPAEFRLGDIRVDTTDSIVLRNSNIYTGVDLGLSGSSGNVNLVTRSLFATGTSRIGSTNLGRGTTRDVNITAETITVDGTGSKLLEAIATGIYSILYDQGVGQAGDINIRTRNLSVINGGFISASTFGQGDGGNVNITATGTIRVDGITPGLFGGVASLIGSTVEEGAIGNGGNVRITAPTLLLSQGGGVTGRAVGEGNGGNVDLNLGILEATSGGQVSTTSQGVGRAGDIEIDVRDRITLSGFDESYNFRATNFGNFSAYGGAFSGLYANTNRTSTGQGGSLRVNTGSLQVRDRGLVSVSSAGTGSAGNLTITASEIDLDNRASLAAETNGGNQGNINLNADLLMLNGGSRITTNARREATGGNIATDADLIVASGNSDIVARAERGKGGSIQISTEGLFGISVRPQLTEQSDINASSQFGLSGSISLTTPNVDPDSGLIELPSEVVDANDRIAATCEAIQNSQFIITGRGGIPTDPLALAASDRPWSDTRDLSATANNSTEKLTISHLPPMEATEWVTNMSGQVELIATQDLGNADNATTCAHPIQ